MSPLHSQPSPNLADAALVNILRKVADRAGAGGAGSYIAVEQLGTESQHDELDDDAEFVGYGESRTISAAKLRLVVPGNLECEVAFSRSSDDNCRSMFFAPGISSAETEEKRIDGKVTAAQTALNNARNNANARNQAQAALQEGSEKSRGGGRNRETCSSTADSSGTQGCRCRDRLRTAPFV